MKRRKPGERTEREKRLERQARSEERSRCIRAVWRIMQSDRRDEIGDLVRGLRGDLLRAMATQRRGGAGGRDAG